MPTAPLLDTALVVRRVSVPAREVVFVRGLFEASEGVGVMFSERGGELTLAAPLAQEAALDEIVRDLVEELGAVVNPEGAPSADTRAAERTV